MVKKQSIDSTQVRRDARAQFGAAGFADVLAREQKAQRGAWLRDHAQELVVEPEDVDPPAEDAEINLLADDATDGDETRLGNGSLNRQTVGFSDDETEDLDERDAGEVGGAERGAFDREGPERLLDEENGN